MCGKWILRAIQKLVTLPGPVLRFPPRNAAQYPARERFYFQEYFNNGHTQERLRVFCHAG